MSVEWQQRYKDTVNQKPETGTVIRTLDGEPLRINIEMTVGRTPFLYTLLYVPCVVGCELGWYARSIKDTTIHGWKAILMPRARDVIINNPGIPADRSWVGVQSVKIVRASQQGKSLLVEIHEAGSWIDTFILERKQRENNAGNRPQETGSVGQPQTVPCDVHQADDGGSAGNAVPLESQ